MMEGGTHTTTGTVRHAPDGPPWRCGIWLALAVMVCFVCSARTGQAADHAHALGVFDARQTRWRAGHGEESRPQRLSEGRRGLRLECPFSELPERRSWDLSQAVAAGGYSAYTLWVRVDRPEAVRRISIYFRSGNGWFAGWIAPGDGQWRKVHLGRRDFESEGQPTGWDRIDGMRISVWKRASLDTRVELSALQGETREIVVLRNSLRIMDASPDAWAVKRHTRLAFRWLEEAGLPVGQLDDTDLRAGLPAACRLLILPYNPLVDPAQAKALDAFCARGGKLIAAQSGAPELLRMLGIRTVMPQRTTPAREFHAMRLLDWVSGGLPPRVTQGNESVLVPEVQDAVVVAYWENGAGERSALPAMTLHPHGAFIGGWLTEVERQEKTDLLLGLIGKLRPDRAASLAHNLLERAPCILGTDSWRETQAVIMAAARETGGSKHVDAYLKDVARYRDQAEAAISQESFPELARRAGVLRGMVRRTYAAAVGPAADEMRAVWCHRAHGVEGLSWDAVAARIKQAGFDTLVPNMAWAGRAYYPSKVLPRLGGTDQLSDCLAACRRHALKLHVWFVCFNLEGADAAHIEALRRDKRLQQDAAGRERVWLCPSHPLNRQLHVSAVAEMARAYPIDGIMLDYIRYPDSESCYCSGCRARFERAAATGPLPSWPGAVRGGTHQAAFQEWRREQISSLVREMQQALKRERPTALLSAAVYRSWPGCRISMGQDWIGWLKKGTIDFACPMNYEQDHNLFETQLRQQLAAAGPAGRIYPGIGVTHPGLAPEETVHQVRLARRAGARGFILFDLERDLLNHHLPLLRAGATSATGPVQP